MGCCRYTPVAAHFNDNNIMDIVQQTINYDVAIEMIAKLRSEAIRRKHAATSEEERQAADAEIKAYNADESVLNGYGSDDAKTSVYDKVFRFYGPMLREKNNSCNRA